MDRTTALGLLRFAYEYLKAFDILIDSDSKITHLTGPKYFLICHAMELGIKSILRHHAYTIDQLRNKALGHNLVNLINELEKKSLYSFSAEQKETIGMVNEYYSTKDFEYIRAGAKWYPQFQDLKAITIDVIRSADGLISRSRT